MLLICGDDAPFLWRQGYEIVAMKFLSCGANVTKLWRQIIEKLCKYRHFAFSIVLIFDFNKKENYLKQDFSTVGKRKGKGMNIYTL